MIDCRTMLAGALALIPASACAGPGGTALIVYKSPLCGCCGAWVDHLRASGFDVRVVERDDIAPVARRLGVPDALRSCHTAVAGGYFVEGHVPAADIRRLLRQHPAARGLAVPGMPTGSPGMKHGGQRETFDTLLVARGGSTARFASHNPLSRTKG